MVLGRLGRRTHHDKHAVIHPVRRDAQLGQAQVRQDAGRGLEVREVVVLLEARVAHELLLRGAGLDHRLDGDRVGHQDAARRFPRELSLQPRVLVVLHLGRGDAKRLGDHRQVDRPVGDREVEPLRARPAGELRAAACERRALAHHGSAAVAPHDGVLEAQALEDSDRLAVLARRDLDLVTLLAQALDDRPQDKRMRGSGAIGPDAHCLSLVWGLD